MSGIQPNSPALPPQAAPPIRVVPQANAQVQAPQPVPDQMSASAAAAELARLKMQLGSPSATEAVMALYGLEALAATHRDQVAPLVIQALSAGGTTQLAALDLVQRLKLTEAAPTLERLAKSGKADLRSGAAAAYAAVTGHALPGAPGAAPRPAAAGVQAASAPAPASLSASALDLTTRMLNPATAPKAAVELSRLPTAQMLAITGRLLSDFKLDGSTLDLIATILSKRVREPGVKEQLRQITRRDPVIDALAVSKATLALLKSGDIHYLKDVLRFLVAPSVDLAPTKRVIIEQLTHSPTALNNPATVVILGAVLHRGDNENRELVQSASHALSLVHSAAARDALAHSPLFDSGDPKLRLRALWDLGKQPAPYPKVAVDQLQRLTKDSNAQVAAAAQALLKK